MFPQHHLYQVPMNLKKPQIQQFLGGILDQSLGLGTFKFRFLFPSKSLKKKLVNNPNFTWPCTQPRGTGTQQKKGEYSFEDEQ